MPALEGLEAGAITQDTHFIQSLLDGEVPSAELTVPIFAFVFFFILMAIYIAKKMKLVRENAADRKGYSELEQASSILGGGILDMIRTFNQEYLQFGHNPITFFMGIIYSMGNWWKEKLGSE